MFRHKLALTPKALLAVLVVLAHPAWTEAQSASYYENGETRYRERGGGERRTGVSVEPGDEPGVWIVEARNNYATRSFQREEYALLRAARLAVREGSSGFHVLEKRVTAPLESQSRRRSSNPPVCGTRGRSGGVPCASWGRTSTNRRPAENMRVSTITTLEISLERVDGSEWIDAAELISELEEKYGL